MATILASSIVASVRNTLVDPDSVRWTSSELLGWLNDGQREIAILRPDASVSIQALVLDPLVSIQTLPSDAIRLVKITRNMGADGETPGRAITLAKQDELDRASPTWHTSTAAAVIKHYVYDGKSPRTFYVYPRPPATPAVHVEAHINVTPVNATIDGVDSETANSTISVDDVYQTALHDYVVMRAKMKSIDTSNEDIAEAYYQRFLNRLGLKLVADKAQDPNRNAPPQPPPQAKDAQNGPAF